MTRHLHGPHSRDSESMPPWGAVRHAGMCPELSMAQHRGVARHRGEVHSDLHYSVVWMCPTRVLQLFPSFLACRVPGCVDNHNIVVAVRKM